MKEELLRNYIKKEIALTEAAGDLDYSDIQEIWKSFTNVFSVLSTGLKSLLNVLRLNIIVTFSNDPATINNAFQRYNTAADMLTRQYKTITDPIVESIGPIEPLLLIANPGGYLAYKFADQSRDKFYSSLIFLEEAGIVEPDWWKRFLTDPSKGPAPTPPGDDKAPNRPSPGTAAVITKMNSIKQTLNRVFGNISPVTESLINEADKGSRKITRNEILDAFRRAPPNTFKVANDDAEKIIKMKKSELETMTKMLEAPTAFLELLSKAKTTQDIKFAISKLQGTAIVADGLENLKNQNFDAQAEKAIQAAKSKNLLNELMKQINFEGSTEKDEKGLVEAVKAYQLRNLLGQSMLQAKKTLIPQTEKMREEFLKKFTADISPELIKEVAPGSELEKIISQGVEKIKQAGKRSFV